MVVSTNILTIRSSDRSSGTPTQFTAQFGNFGGVLTGITKVKLLNCLIPNTIYNIRTGVNNVVVWNRGGNNYNYQIPAGYYNITQLLSQIQTGMNGVDANSYALSVGSTSYLVTITGTSAFTLNWLSNPSSLYSCWRELGWTQADTSSATSLTAPNVYNLIQPYFLFIEVVELTKNVETTKPGEISTFTIPVDVNGFDVISYKAADSYDQIINYNPSRNLSTLTVSVYLSNAELANLNGAEWYMNLEVTTNN